MEHGTSLITMLAAGFGLALVVATPDLLGVRRMVETARTLKPAIEIVLRRHSEDESELLRKEGMGKVPFGEEELATGIVVHVIERFSADKDAARAGRQPA